MHDYLRSIGFSSFRSKKQLQQLVDWTLEQPDHLDIISLDGESNLAVAERAGAGHAGIVVVGEMDERGEIIPEHYFPYIASTHVSSDAHITYDKERTKTGFIGMCEDGRMGMALIFSIRNIGEVMKRNLEAPFGEAFTRVNFSALASEGMVLLPIVETEKAILKGQEDAERRQRLYQEACEGVQSSIEALAREEAERYRRVMNRLNQTDIFTVVDNFFMPSGMESDQYYFMGKITTVQKIENPMSGESFYRMIIDSNGMEILTAINEADLQGIPAPGYRLKCRAWLTGELKK